jgi:hypothetical protein
MQEDRLFFFSAVQEKNSIFIMTITSSFPGRCHFIDFSWRLRMIEERTSYLTGIGNLK